MRDFSKENNPRWKGGVKIHPHGYRLIASPNHPYKDKQGYVREHRLVIEAIMGRFLIPGEEVHHLDGDKKNNDPKNLVFFATKREHLVTCHSGNGLNTRFKKGQPATNPKNGEDHICEMDGVVFYKSKKTRKRFCSKLCSDAWKKGKYFRGKERLLL